MEFRFGRQPISTSSSPSVHFVVSSECFTRPNIEALDFHLNFGSHLKPSTSPSDVLHFAAVSFPRTRRSSEVFARDTSRKILLELVFAK
ncbi:hypothetical protein V2J09_021903 [Rumex salicifolius]